MHNIVWSHCRWQGVWEGGYRCCIFNAFHSTHIHVWCGFPTSSAALVMIVLHVTTLSLCHACPITHRLWKALQPTSSRVVIKLLLGNRMCLPLLSASGTTCCTALPVLQRREDHACPRPTSRLSHQVPRRPQLTIARLLIFYWFSYICFLFSAKINIKLINSWKLRTVKSNTKKRKTCECNNWWGGNPNLPLEGGGRTTRIVKIMWRIWRTHETCCLKKAWRGL